MGRLHSPQRVSTFDEVELVALMTHDPARAEVFIRRTAGGHGVHIAIALEVCVGADLTEPIEAGR
ncbi:hypothetical protein [Mycolicibacterium confluentis]|uniref:hypothetical protein n=1 Tax=Mycolicibacterium confluentis TaxID=28047 RepID=UPI001056BEF7|nr:hypothetical protein [Mycolicibacterium confluentis]MCV7318359.1 hypothetical protein [Mycolicibacterium confluentis]